MRDYDSFRAGLPGCAEADPEMSDDKRPLLIKRYASRRFYNTETSEYITLQEISDCIRSGRDVRIVDRKTGDDLTRQYLIQIIADHEARGEQILPVNVLMEAVRTCNDQAFAMVPQFLDTSFEILKKNQDRTLESMKAIANPMAAFEDLGKSQQAFLSQALNGWMGEKEPDDKPTGSVETELDELKRMVAELQSKVANM